MQILIFGINGVEYGILLEDVDFICEKVNVVKVPCDLQAVRGSVMLRDKVVPVYSLASRLGLEEQEYRYLLVVKVKNIKIALEVGMIDRVIWIEKEAFISLPVTVKAMESCFQAVFAYEKKLIEVLDISGLLTKQEMRDLCLFIEKTIEKTVQNNS